MVSFLTLGKITASVSLAAALTACSGGVNPSADNASETETAVLVCPDDKVLASPDDYKALVLPSPDGDFAAWHKENSQRSDVTTTPSGLQYKVVQKGLKDGASPVGGELVTVHYHGYFPDGKVFDSSYKRGQTIDFPANAVIKGWVESLQAMKTCEARILYIPGDLAYGQQGRPGIPKNATLLFNVQLIAVKK